MKKLLALLIACAGLTAMAVNPVMVEKSNFTKARTHGAMVMKTTNKAGMDLKAISFNKDVVTPKALLKGNNLTPNDNKLMRKAPRRAFSSNADVLAANYLDFRYVYTFGDDGYMTESDYHYRGGEGVAFAEEAGQLYCAGLYYNPFTSSGYYLPLNIDYTTGVVSFETGYYLDNDTTQGKLSGNTFSGYTRVDTVDVSILVDLAYFTDENFEGFSDITGKIYEDGSIIFDDTYVVFGYRVINTFKGRNTSSLALNATDTTEFLDIYDGTQFIVPNAVHEYEMRGEADSDDAYMYQADDTTVYVFNLMGMGMPGVVMNIYEDGTMTYPFQEISEISPAARNYYANYYGSGYNWDNTKYYYILGVYYDEAQGDYVDYAEEPFPGTVERDAIKWDACEYYLPGIVRVSDGAEMSLGSYPFLNNVLRFTNGDYFLLGKSATPEITYVVNDDNVVVTAAGMDGATVELYVLDEEGNPTLVDNPYTVARGEEDQEIYFAALAQEDGKNWSDAAVVAVTIPALEQEYTGPLYILGEVNGNNWSPANGVEMTYNEETKVFTATVSAEAQNYDANLDANFSYFSFTKKLAESADDWGAIAGDRIGAVSEGDFLVIDEYLDTELSLTAGENAFKIPSGYSYELTVNLETMKLTIHRVVTSEWEVGDVNHDHNIDVSDVTLLIAYVLGNNPEGFYVTEANVNDGDDNIDVGDVTALIAKVLSN